MPNIAYFENLHIGTSPEFFFQALTNCIKNNVLSHQSTIFKLKRENKTRLEKRISELKKNFNENTGEILVLERNLSNIYEQELRDELQHYSKFEILNNEKITRHFMDLVKASKNEASINEIKKDDGSEFISENERSEYIKEYFEEIYKQPNNRSKNSSLDDILNFLGPLQNDEIISGAKLTNEERDSLEGRISLEEITQSINESNMASAPGADGISNKFIQKFWDFFKVPFLKLTQYCFDNNTLPSFYKAANIKLIPKKGDLSKIKNWRPISLLNCFYKIISRVITKRLRIYMDKMTPICQKGYSSTRYCQEVLIQVIETIEKCKNRNIKGAVISLDIKKAFDSLSHSYLQSVYKFYNFGPNLIKWITLLSTQRRACIIITNDTVSELFDLERGNAQGDTISPFLFNLGYQLLLFKLELYLQIEGTQGDIASRVSQNNLAGDLADINRHNNQEVRRHDPKVSAMADDCTLIVKLDLQNLQIILQILEEFESISGLGCNIDKTSLMPIGSNEPVPENILNLGLNISSEITLLGAKLKNTGICFDSNGELIISKIKKQINFWKRFSLSLPGRINVAKTFLFSQINYLGCFMPFSDRHVEIMSRDIEKFVKGKLQIGLQKIYDDKKIGGLGLFKIKDFLDSQCCAWIKRATNQDTLWKKELKFFSNGSVFNLRKINFNKDLNPILYHISACFEKFSNNFTAKNENFRKMWIFDNPCFKFDGNNGQYLKRNFFDEQYFVSEKNRIVTLTMDNLIDPNLTLKTKETFQNETGVLMTDLKFGVLLGAARNAIINFKKNDANEKKTDRIQDFCMRIKKGSKRFRKIIMSGGGLVFLAICSVMQI